MAVEPSQLKHWYKDGSRFHAVAEVDNGWSFMACGMLSTGEPIVVDKTPERICKKCRLALKRMYLKPVEESSTGRNSMQPIPQEIRTLIERCEVNEVRFDNDDMSTALTYAEALRIENKRLCEALKRARELARKDCLSMREFAREIGVTPTQLSAWTDEIPNREPDFKD